ncbi:MAG TPA: nucleotidyltransferase domain-containing protein [Cryptosporangiaceae bacterium]|nr:nucleotidyltransferase domain-containing protein [Cryptosporangiaceae bacterium]
MASESAVDVTELDFLLDPRWQVAHDLADIVRRRWPADVLAVGVHGSLAHGDDRDGTDIDLAVVTYKPDTGPPPTRARIAGTVVRVAVTGAEDALVQARTLTTRWPLIADRYLHRRALYDESGWHARLRDTHLNRLAEAGTREFTALARDAWCDAFSLLERAVRCTEWHDSDGALLLLGEARTAGALTDGLLSRTYFRASTDATRRTGLAGLDIVEVRDRLGRQADELAKRGWPVDAMVSDLF